jgi:hypothetical protein
MSSDDRLAKRAPPPSLPPSHRQASAGEETQTRTREVTEAHFLHERSGLQAVLKAPVKQPTRLAWIPGREELLVTTREGELLTVDPVLGTRTLAYQIGEAAVLRVADDRQRVLIMTREGTYQIRNPRGELLLKGNHSFLGGMDGYFADPYLLIFGDEAGGRFLELRQDDVVKVRIPLPSRVIAALDPQGKGLLCRSTDAGLQVVAFGREKLPKDEPTAHVLRAAGKFVLGFTPTGVAVWGQEGGQPRSMRLPELTAGDVSKDGTLLGLGTRSGSVALARIDQVEKRVHPDLVRAFSTPVTCVAFASRGRWLATGAEGLWIWSWES